MTRVHYELEYQAGVAWFPARDDEGEPRRYPTMPDAARALDACAQDAHRWRVVRVKEIRRRV